MCVYFCVPCQSAKNAKCTCYYHSSWSERDRKLHHVTSFYLPFSSSAHFIPCNDTVHHEITKWGKNPLVHNKITILQPWVTALVQQDTGLLFTSPLFFFFFANVGKCIPVCLKVESLDNEIKICVHSAFWFMHGMNQTIPVLKALCLYPNWS